MTFDDALERLSMSFRATRSSSSVSPKDPHLQGNHGCINLIRDLPAHAFKAATLDRSVTPPGVR
jgi:hypothetical protein